MVDFIHLQNVKKNKTELLKGGDLSKVSLNSVDIQWIPLYIPETVNN